MGRQVRAAPRGRLSSLPARPKPARSHELRDASGPRRRRSRAMGRLRDVRFAQDSVFNGFVLDL
jgi:hypothetical protein